jgi:hypothetical protein
MGAYAKTFFLLWANDCAEQVDSFLSVAQQFLLRDAVNIKIF